MEQISFNSWQRAAVQNPVFIQSSAENRVVLARADILRQPAPLPHRLDTVPDFQPAVEQFHEFCNIVGILPVGDSKWYLVHVTDALFLWVDAESLKNYWVHESILHAMFVRDVVEFLQSVGAYHQFENPNRGLEEEDFTMVLSKSPTISMD